MSSGMTDQRPGRSPFFARQNCGKPPAGLAAPAAKIYSGETYYGRPVLKPSPYGKMVAAYIAIAGLGGGAQLIATLADLIARKRASNLVRRGRQIAFATAPIGAALLIADLHTPQRFYNMLRIFRRTSPMSIGTYALMNFGLFSGLAVLGDAIGVPALGRVAQIPAALAGAAMTSYTAGLLSATSTPLWASEPGLLAVRFASSAIASGAAALSLSERLSGKSENCRALDGIAMAATGTELIAGLASSQRYRVKRLDGPLREKPLRNWQRLGVLGAGGILPLGLYAFGSGGSRRASIAASVAAIAAGMLMRSVLLEAGNRSAKRPADYFRVAQADGGLPA